MWLADQQRVEWWVGTWDQVAFFLLKAKCWSRRETLGKPRPNSHPSEAPFPVTHTLTSTPTPPLPTTFHSLLLSAPSAWGFLPRLGAPCHVHGHHGRVRGSWENYIELVLNTQAHACTHTHPIRKHTRMHTHTHTSTHAHTRVHTHKFFFKNSLECFFSDPPRFLALPPSISYLSLQLTVLQSNAVNNSLPLNDTC